MAPYRCTSKVSQMSSRHLDLFFMFRFKLDDCCYLNKSNPYHLIHRIRSDKVTPNVLRARKLLHQQALHNKVNTINQLFVLVLPDSVR